jgi:hypothetical protein
MLLPFFHILLREKIIRDDLVLYPILPTLFEYGLSRLTTLQNEVCPGAARGNAADSQTDCPRQLARRLGLCDGQTSHDCLPMNARG